MTGMSSGWDEQARLEKLVDELRAENSRLREKYRIQTEARKRGGFTDSGEGK